MVTSMGMMVPQVALPVQVERSQTHQRGAVHHDTGVLETQEGDKQADTGGDGHTDGRGDGIKNLLAQAGDGQQNENDAVGQDQDQGVGIAEAQVETDGVDEIGVEPHAGGLRQGQVGQQTDEHRAEDGGDGRSNVHGVVGDLAFQLGKHAGIDHKDIGHGHKGGEAGDKLGADCGAVLLQFKELFHCITLRFRGLR